jgi:UDP-N-acetylglucosamine 1-carboxyvinyltransferase
MEQLGAQVEIDHSYIMARAKDGLRAGNISFDVSSVGATRNLLMAAVTAAAARSSNAMRARDQALCEFWCPWERASGDLQAQLIIDGVPELHPADAAMIPDRIEISTLLVAAAITGGDVEVTGVDLTHLGATLSKLDGGLLHRGRHQFRPDPCAGASRTDLRHDASVPGFPTDMQAQMMAVASIANGTSVIEDTIYLDRFSHVAELQRLGARIELKGNVAVVKGVDKLSGAPVMATDLRASAALALGALIADGETRISRIYHLDRGYERFDQKLTQLGARVERVQE